MDKTKYVVDTCVILDREEYRKYDYMAFPKYWDNFDKLVEKGVIIAPELVKNEINKNGNETTQLWAENHSYMFKPITQKVTECLIKLSTDYALWYNNIRNLETSADPYLIAFSMAYNLDLITQEEYNLNNVGMKNETSPKNYKIPVICELLGANIFVRTRIKSNDNAQFNCICFSEFIKKENLNIF